MRFIFNNTILTDVEVSCILKIQQYLFFIVILFSWNCESQYNEM